jgi:hypothetical protein
LKLIIIIQVEKNLPGNQLLIDLRTSILTNHFLPAINILTCLVLVGSLFSMAAQASMIVQIEPQALTMALGDRAQFSIEIMNADNMYGFELHISYDPTKVHVVDEDPSVAGIQLRPGDMYEVDRGFLVANEADNEAGKAVYAFTLLAPEPPLAGNGTLVNVEVDATGVGWSAIELEDVIIASPNGEALPFVANDGEVIIEDVPEGTPTLNVTPGEQLTLTATKSILPTGTQMGTLAVSSLPTMQIPDTTPPPTQRITPSVLSTLADSKEISQFDQRSMIFGLVILGAAILVMLFGAWFLKRWWYKRE